MREDISKAMKKFNTNTFLKKREAKEIEDHISDGEVVIFFTSTFAKYFCRSNEIHGIIAITDKRVVFYRKVSKNAKIFTLETFALNEIKAIDYYQKNFTYIELDMYTTTFEFSIPTIPMGVSNVTEAIGNATSEYIKKYGPYKPKEEGKPTSNSANKTVGQIKNENNHIGTRKHGQKCIHCGAPLKKEWKFCEFCGVDLRL